MCHAFPFVSSPGPGKSLMFWKNHIVIYELPFKEGIMVAKKDVHTPKNPGQLEENVSKLHVMKVTQFLESWGP